MRNLDVDFLCQNSLTVLLFLLVYSVADPDLQGGGGRGHRDPEIRGVGSPKNFFSALRASFWSKNKGGGGPPGPSPGSATATLAILIPPVRLFEQAIF